jgi:hypothetical protein
MDNLTGDGAHGCRRIQTFSGLLRDCQLAETIDGVDMLSRVR